MVGTTFSARAVISAFAGLVLLALASHPASAQNETGYSDLPGIAPADATTDPFPFDPQLAIRRYIKGALPSRWWANEPQWSLGVFAVMIHIPDDWRGNPTSAMDNLCPPSHNPLWRNLQSIELVPFYKHARWTGTICRK